MPGQYGNYDPTTNTGSLDQAFLESDAGKEYLRLHPEDAFDIYAGHQYGGTQNYSDNFREFMNTQRDRFVANNKLRIDLGNWQGTNWGGYENNQSPLDYLNTQGFDAAVGPKSTQQLLKGLTGIAQSPGNQYSAQARAFTEDPNNAQNLWNLTGWARPTNSLVSPWLQRLGYDNRPGRQLGGGTFLDYLARTFPWQRG